MVIDMQQKRENLTDYSDSELSIRVFNEESLYRMRHNTRLLIEALQELYIFNEAQEQELLEDIESDLNE
jgi:hypothetical protein